MRLMYTGVVAHESIFNMNDGNYRCPSSQQGYSPFTTWTRGLAWLITGYAEQLEFFETLADDDLIPYGGKTEATAHILKTAKATSDFYIEKYSCRRYPVLGHRGTGAASTWILSPTTRRPV